MIRLEFVDQHVVLAGLFGAIVWDLLTWWWGLPTSSSHALIGGYAGAAMAQSGDALRTCGHAQCHYCAWLDQDSGFHRRRAPDGAGAGIHLHALGVLDLPAFGTAAGRSIVPPPAIALGRRLQPGSWRERCAEDHGHHRGRAVHGRIHDQVGHAGKLGTPALANHSRPPMRPSLQARISADGASSKPWARRSPN